EAKSTSTLTTVTTAPTNDPNGDAPMQQHPHSQKNLNGDNT
ncbi:15917_t:CDS:1, partial [Gigaspora margarita]